MYIPYVSVNLDTISLWVIVASLESMPYNSLAINPSCYQINKFHLIIEVDLANTATLTLHVPTILHTRVNN